MEREYQLTRDPVFYLMAAFFAFLTTALPALLGQFRFMPIGQTLVLAIFMAIAVRRGDLIWIAPFAMHRRPVFFPDPERFDPDRWTREREAARHSHAYHPFAAGPRICIGNNFSLLESHLLLAMLAQRFTARLRPGYEPRWVMRGTLGLANGLPMTIRAR